jgi:hypothetical protein
VALDRLMQSPGGKEEDTGDGFAHGGWAAPFSDAAVDDSTLLEGDAAEAAARLKEKPGKSLVVLGSGDLGSGRRLFREGGPCAARPLVDCQKTTTGVVIAAYRRSE